MKKNVKLISCVLVGLCFLVLSVFMPSTAAKVFCASGYYGQLADFQTDAVGAITYDYDVVRDDSFDMRVYVSSYDFDVGDKIYYYYSKQGSGVSGLIPLTESFEKIISTASDRGESERFNPLSLSGTGTYTITALIYSVQLEDYIQAAPLTIIINPPTEQYTISIDYEHDFSTGGLGTYVFTAQVFIEENIPVAADDLIIYWYSVDQNGDQLAIVGRKKISEPFLFTPSTTGKYGFIAQIEGTSGSFGDVKSEPKAINVTKDQTLTLFLIVLGIVGVSSIGLVVVIVYKIQHERVW